MSTASIKNLNESQREEVIRQICTRFANFDFPWLPSPEEAKVMVSILQTENDDERSQLISKLDNKALVWLFMAGIFSHSYE